ncbi:MAG: TIGR02217 family protein [Maricaulaceae bacterium]
MSAFHDVRFPVEIALRATGGPERRTEVLTLGSGRERRNSPWRHGRRRWDAGLGVRSRDDLHEVIRFFEARHGRLFGFRWRDPIDHKSCPPSRTPGPLDQILGTGDGAQVEFPLIKSYADAGGGYDRPISKPVAGLVRVALNGAELAAEAFSVNLVTGVVSLQTPPTPNQTVTAGFAFDTPVRFDVDHLEVRLDAIGAGAAPHIPIIEVQS